MEIFQLLPNTPVVTWVVLPIMIFLLRVFDVSLGTLRIIFVSRGKKLLAPVVGFFEVTIWLLAISQIMQNLDNIACFFAYSGGFAMGNFVGILIEDKLAMGTLVIRIIIANNETDIQKKLYDAGFGVTSIDAHGMSGDVKIVYTVIKRRDLSRAIEIIDSCEYKAFYSIEEAKAVKEGFFPPQTRVPLKIPFAKNRSLTRHGK
ncbi:MAG TPA: DUF2179 domain-containing protein [Clostridiales bacterium]|nr:DUF2179 domain-containing protein [Clostridiales bacterium]